MVLSADADANIFENGWNDTWLTESTGPRKVCLTLPLPRSNSLHVWSMLADTIKSPVSLNLTPQTG